MYHVLFSLFFARTKSNCIIVDAEFLTGAYRTDGGDDAFALFDGFVSSELRHGKQANSTQKRIRIKKNIRIKIILFRSW